MRFKRAIEQEEKGIETFVIEKGNVVESIYSIQLIKLSFHQ